MVTDQQFQYLQKRIDELEKTVRALSLSLTEMRMTSRDRVIEVPKRVEGVKRDKTRYVLNGQKYSKRELVLAGLKQYISDRHVTSSEQLLAAFPQDLQGSLGIVRPVFEAELYENAQSRFYFDDDDILKFEDGLFAVCKEWTAKNIDNFIDAMETAGYSVTKITR